MNIEISDDSAELIKGLVADSKDQSVSEYIQALVLEDQMTRNGISSFLCSSGAELERLAIEGLDSGAPVELNSEFWKARRQRITGES